MALLQFLTGTSCYNKLLLHNNFFPACIMNNPIVLHDSCTLHNVEYNRIFWTICMHQADIQSDV